MIEATTTTKTTVHLTMDEDTADWLLRYLQNNVPDESPSDAEMRRLTWSALNTALGGSDLE
jgi:hypothetical protein